MKIIECPRDAMQGLPTFIPTEAKIQYINLLLNIGFDTIDFGSFVSEKAVPQMKDTQKVLDHLELDPSLKTKLLAIVANKRGVDIAVQQEKITYLGFPLSLSESFQQRNTKKSIKEAKILVQEIQENCEKFDKQQVVYLSMGFGNPYGDPYSPQYVIDFTAELVAMGVKIISLADTIGSASPELIKMLYERLIPAFPEVEFGAHLHTIPQKAEENILATIDAGCKRIDTAMGGFGGCPMAKDELTGNLSTETLVNVLRKRNIDIHLDLETLKKASKVNKEVMLLGEKLN